MSPQPCHPSRLRPVLRSGDSSAQTHQRLNEFYTRKSGRSPADYPFDPTTGEVAGTSLSEPTWRGLHEALPHLRMARSTTITRTRSPRQTKRPAIGGGSNICHEWLTRRVCCTIRFGFALRPSPCSERQPIAARTHSCGPITITPSPSTVNDLTSVSAHHWFA